jgi:hypothetical protein
LGRGSQGGNLPLETASIFKTIIEDLSLKSCTLGGNPKNAITGSSPHLGCTYEESGAVSREDVQIARCTIEE